MKKLIIIIALLFITITSYSNYKNLIIGNWARQEFIYGQDSFYYLNCKTQFAVIEEFSNDNYMYFQDYVCEQGVRTVTTYRYYIKDNFLHLWSLREIKEKKLSTIFKIISIDNKKMVLMNEQKQLVKYIRL